MKGVGVGCHIPLFALHGCWNAGSGPDILAGSFGHPEPMDYVAVKAWDAVCRNGSIYPSSIYPSICLSIFRSIYPSIHLYLSIHLAIYPSVYLSIKLSIHVSVCPCIYLSVYPLTCSFVSPCLPIYITHIHFHKSMHARVCLCVCEKTYIFTCYVWKEIDGWMDE